jgi:phosphatidate cytidylyltransferase
MAFSKTEFLITKFFLFPIFCFSLMISSYFLPQHSIELWSAFLCLYICFYVWLFGTKSTNKWILSHLTRSAIGFFYVGLLPLSVLKLLELPRGELWFTLLITIVFSGDTLAYFGGKFFGKNKLSPSLSPQKTIEGGITGLFGSCLVSVILGHYFFSQDSSLFFALLGLIAGVFAQTGDLFESLLKRIAKVKDSGKIMPGHGGVLDRVDGVLFAAPIVYLFANI